MKNAVEVSSGAMMYVPNFKKNRSGIQKLMGSGRDAGTQRIYCDRINLLSLF
jgi:hypothetical protein